MTAFDADIFQDLTIGQRIMYLRKFRGFNKRQQFVDEVKHVSYSYIWEIENGSKTTIPDEILEKIAQVLQVPVELLKNKKGNIEGIN